MSTLHLRRILALSHQTSQSFAFRLIRFLLLIHPQLKLNIHINPSSPQGIHNSGLLLNRRRRRRSSSNSIKHPPHRIPNPMPPRRRRTRPLNLDPPTLHDSGVPSTRLARATNRDAVFPASFRPPLPVLGVRGRLPHLDGGAEWAEPAAAGWALRVRDVDVRGAQCC